MNEPYLREMIGDPRYVARDKEGDAFRASVTKAFQDRYPGEMPRDGTGRQIDDQRTVVSVRAYGRRGEDQRIEHVSAHQRGSPSREVRTAPAARPAQATGYFDAPTLDPIAGRLWENQSNPEFRQQVAIRESTAQRSDHGYGARRRDWGALGRYQLRQDGLENIGWRNADGSWTARAAAAGVTSRETFLANPAAQEAAFTAYLADNERQLRVKGAWGLIGQTIRVGQNDTVMISAAGLAGAAHLEGPGGVSAFLRRSALGRDISDPLSQRIIARLRFFGSGTYQPLYQPRG